MTHVLILEPDRLLAQIYQRAFEEAGFEASYASSGQDAVDRADELTPDIVVLELQLPAHNGLEFLYEFRSYTDWQSIPVIVNTSIPRSSIGSAKESLYDELGIRSWHYKPETSLQVLVRSVSEELQSK